MEDLFNVTLTSEELFNIFLNIENETFDNETYVDEENEEFDDFMIEGSRLIHVIGRPILIIFGTIGNLLAFYVMQQGSLKKVSTCFYMAILALADTGMLWCGAFVWWVSHLTRWEVNPEEWTDCKLAYFLFYFIRHYSSLLLILMTVEKLIAIYFPLKTKNICTVKNAKRASFAGAVIMFTYDVHLLFVIRANKEFVDLDKCIFTPVWYKHTFFQTEAVIYSIAPFTIMIIANCAIIFKFMMAKIKSKIGGSESTKQALSKSAAKGTAMLITVSVTFMILTGPVSVLYIHTNIPNPFFYAVGNILQYLNHSINSVLYCIVGSRFRNELLRMLPCTRGRLLQTQSTYRSEMYQHSISTISVPVSVQGSGSTTTLQSKEILGSSQTLVQVHEIANNNSAGSPKGG